METRVYTLTTAGDWGRHRGIGETTETIETRVCREQGRMTAGDWVRLRGTGETTETMETMGI